MDEGDDRWTNNSERGSRQFVSIFPLFFNQTHRVAFCVALRDLEEINGGTELTTILYRV